MIKSLELSDPSSCMSRAGDDEMTFVLLGRDAAAPAAIRAWIRERIRLGKNNEGDPQIVEARACAEYIERELAARLPEAESMNAESNEPTGTNDDLIPRSTVNAMRKELENGSPNTAAMICPHCASPLTMKQAIEILNGTGYQRTAQVRLPDGRIEYVPAGLVNPREVEVLG